MFSYNPGFKGPQVQQVSTNPAGHMSNANANLESIRKIGDSIQDEAQFESTAKARILAAQQAHVDEIENIGLNQTNSKELVEIGRKNAIQLKGIQSQDSIENIKAAKANLVENNKRIVKVAKEKTKQVVVKNALLKLKEQNQNKINLLDKAHILKTDTLNGLKFQEQKRLAKVKEKNEKFKLNYIEKVKANTANVKAKTASTKIGASMLNKTIDKAAEQGGVDLIVEDALDAMDNDNAFFDFKIDDKSKKFLKTKLSQELTKSESEMAKFRMAGTSKEAMKKYINNFMNNYGTIIEAPWYSQSDDSWSVNVKK